MTSFAQLAMLSFMGVLCGACDGSNGGSSSSSCVREAPSMPCQGVTCAGATPWCCSPFNDPSVHAQCIAAHGTCSIPSDSGVYPIDLVDECDDFSDCPVGNVCCSNYNKGLNTSSTSCAPSCETPYASQVCHQDCECVAGKTCTSGRCH